MLTVMLRRLGLAELETSQERAAKTTAAMILLSVMGACITGLLAQICLPLPGTPVPLTGQVLAVLVCGAVLGSGYGTLSQVIYVVLGVAGIPWFSGGGSGLAVLLGPAGGYLVGFVVAALFLGTASEGKAAAKTMGGQIKRMLAAIAVIWFFGLVHLIVMFEVTLTTAVMQAVVPFIAAYTIMAVMAMFFTSAVLPKKERPV